MKSYVGGKASFRPLELFSRKGYTPTIFPLDQGRCFYYFSGRYALAAGIKVLSLGRGDAVLLPSLNCGAEVDPMLHLGIRQALRKSRVLLQIILDKII